ncbi:MAG: polysaccharide lyase [Pirellulaceae bacterium]|nr:polysaccharide lyase [Pirellulaceae bacterium]
MRENVAVHGGYAWFSSTDGKFSHGEGVAGRQRVWVQPPGTPAIGLAFLRAYAATGDEVHLQAARDVGRALIEGQLRSGGWGYSIEFDPETRNKIPYRIGPNGGRENIPPDEWPGGWDVWKKRQFDTNKTLIDDDTTPAAIRFLAKLDQSLAFADAEVHEAAMYAIESAMGAQYPIGAWGHNYDRFPVKPPNKSHYPVLKASYPETWTRMSTNDFTGCYMLNDRNTMNMIQTMFFVAEIYNDDRYWYSARRGAEFLLLAQMPEPQPAWAQQYNRQMQPVWDRKFEPPAITGGESQDAMRTLMRAYRITKDKRFLEPIPRAVAYMKKSLRDDGKLARYYELKTNRPIYFDKDYQMTYDDKEMPDHYGFIRDSFLTEIENEYQALVADPNASEPKATKSEIAQRAAKAVASQRSDGGWLEKGFVRDAAGKKVVPDEGVVSSQTFIDNTTAIADYLTAGAN